MPLTEVAIFNASSNDNENKHQLNNKNKTQSLQPSNCDKCLNFCDGFSDGDEARKKVEDVRLI
jgi:hypothetical protein